jgi:hypothetical protein
MAWHGIQCQLISFLHFFYFGLFQEEINMYLWWFMFINLE